MFPSANRQPGTINEALMTQGFWMVQNSASNPAINNNLQNNRSFAWLNECIDNRANELEGDMDEEQPIQFCNMKENILRLEELAKKNGISLDDDRIDIGGQNLFEELCEVNPRAKILVRRDSFGSPCWFDACRRFSGLKPEHVPEETKLAQLVYQFGLEHVRELPVLPMEAINSCLLAV